MRNLCWFVALVFVSVSALAQKIDTVSKNVSKIVIGGPDDHPKVYNKPLIIVDGTEYTGDLKQIEPSSITEVNVVKDSSYIYEYGKKGENGIIFITTRGHKNIYTEKKGGGIYKSSLPDSAMYVIDGEISDKKLRGLDPKDILSVNILKKSKTAEQTNINPSSDMVIVVTKAGAVKSYKNKLSGFSTDYKKYMDSHNDDDSGLTYIVDGSVYDKGQDSLEKLYKLPKEKISKVAISKGKVTSVNIKTKK